jgi:hypothetical protein
VLEAILVAVPLELGALADKASAKQASGSITAARVNVDHVRRVMLQRLHQDWDRLPFRPVEEVEDFALRLSSPMQQQMVCHGDDDLMEAQAVEKLLRVVLKYSQIALAMETRGEARAIEWGVHNFIMNIVTHVMVKQVA